jgi:hypothetical protein
MQRMSVTINDPADNDVFPDSPNDWTAYVSIGCADSVDGMLYDFNSGQLYQTSGNGPVCISGPDSNGQYTWQVPFGNQDLTAISKNDSLLIYCYDVETGDGASCADTASQGGGAYGCSPSESGGMKTLDAPPPIQLFNGDPTIDSKNKKVYGSVILPGGGKGFVFLVLSNLGNRKILVKSLQAGDSTPQPYEFDGDDANIWLKFCLVAVIKGRKGYDVYPKPKHKKTANSHMDGMPVDLARRLDLLAKREGQTREVMLFHLLDKFLPRD